MPKNFKKLLVCIVATFGITTLVFSCCKKVGLCASDSTVVSCTDYPFPTAIPSGISLPTFVPDSSLYDEDNPDSILNYIKNKYNESGYRNYHYISEIGNGYIEVTSAQLSGTQSYSGCDFSGSGSNLTFDFHTSVRTVIRIYPDNTFIEISNTSGYVNSSCDLGKFYNGSVYLLPKNQFIYGYPIYNNWDPLPAGPSKNYYAFSNDASFTPIFNAHSKGGVLSNYIDSVDLIENSSDLPDVDTSAPSNSSSVPDWLQKILNGIGKVNQSIKGGVLTLGDYIGSGFEKVGEWFEHFEDSVGGFFDRVHDSIDDIIDTIEGLKDGSTVALAQATWEDEFDNSIFKDFVDLKGSIEDDILTPIRNANAPSSLSFTIPLITVNVPNLVNNGGSVSTSTNNVYLFGRSVTLDFSWYTRSISGGVFNGSSIRDYLVPIIATFLYVGMVVHLLFKIPSFLSGSSGFSNTLHSVVVSNNGSKFKKA